jgi:nucleotide-binding universal stress UspA family protein
MYEKLLVPIDGSELAEIALPFAEELAGRLGSQIDLLYVSESGKDPYRRMHRLYLQKMVDGVRRGVRRYVPKSASDNIKIKSVILNGKPADEILEYADKEDIGMIIMSTHGRSGISRWSMGSVAEKVVRATARPLTLIRAKGDTPDMHAKGILKKILVPLDGSKEGEVVLPYVEEVASKLGAAISLLQVIDVGYATVAVEGYSYLLYAERQMESFKQYAQSYLSKVANRLNQKGVATSVIVRPGKAADEIVRYTEEFHTDLVAMATHGRSGVGRWVFGSVAEKVLYEGDTPLLLVRVAGTSPKSA